MGTGPRRAGLIEDHRQKQGMEWSDEERLGRILSAFDGVRALYLFGSFASGVPTPRSDVDLLIISEDASVDVFLPYFLSVSVPVDIHVMTPEAFQAKRTSGRGIAGAAVTKGTRLL